ncbi:MAG TPA: DASS family sodium-coupled anion symporter [Lacibacter sp.]|nr:DASS family sodium-coupled anion symporter [Lacibacter sp.]
MSTPPLMRRYYAGLAAGLLLALAAWWWNPFTLEPAACKAVAVGALMITWWVAEVLPMPAVALLPLLLFPLLGVEGIDGTSKAYSNPVIFLFMGGFFLGLAIEKWNLHQRIALTILSRTGASGNRILLGFVLATSLLSMGLSNTATTMMLFPIALSVIAVLKEHPQPGSNPRYFALSLLLIIAWASNLGGMATLIGTPPNVAFAAFIEKKYGYQISFFNWMLVCLPLVVVLLAVLYGLLAHVLFPSRIRDSAVARDYIKSELAALGPLGPTERRVLLIFGGTAFLWMSRELVNQIPYVRLDDNMIAVLGALALFATPAAKTDRARSRMVLDWSDTGKMAWGILLLFGGGIALANGLETTGVMGLIGKGLASAGLWHGLVLVLVITVLSIFLSEVMSNVAQVIVFAPVLAALADALQLEPLLLGLPMTLAASAAAMLPMGTPPNAIVFGSGQIPLRQMLRAGLVMNLVSIVLITLFCWYVLPQVMGVLGK